MMLLVYIRYSHLRISSNKEIKTLRNKYDKQSSALHTADEKLVTDTKTDSKKIQDLLSEVDELHKDKENEIKLRLSAEKQIALTLQKMKDLEARMEDWKVMQDAVMRDSKDAIITVGNDLYRKLNDSYKQEVETTKNLVGRVSKTVTDLFENNSIGKKTPSAKADSNNGANYEINLGPEIDAKTDANAEPEIKNNPGVKKDDPASKELIADLIETMKANGNLANKDYFLSANFDESKAKLLLCEIAFIGNDTLHVIDYKACHYLAEFDKIKNTDEAAVSELKKKLDKYFSYLSDPKYSASIAKVMSTTAAKFTKTVTIVALPSKPEVQTLKEIHYFEKAEKLGFQIMDSNGVNNIVL